jgi:hypothetical protein
MDKIDVFNRYADLGKQMDKRHILSLLIDMYMDYCGISLSYRTVVYDCAWAVFKQYAKNEPSEFSGDEYFCEVMGQINPDYTEEYDKYDIGIVESERYADCCIGILDDYRGDAERCAALCYGFQVYCIEDEE